MAIAIFALTACGGEQSEEKGGAELPQPYARYMEILDVDNDGRQGV